MITDYQIIAVNHPTIDSVVLWDHRVWLNHKQLQALFHVNKAKLERMISKLAEHMSLYSHYESFSMVRLRKQGDKEFEYVYQIRYYDEQLIRALRELNNNPDMDSFMKMIEQMKN